MNNVFFVIGANGVGKTTTVNFLKKTVSMSDFSVYDFDERGVPDNADKEWRKSETEYWLNLGIENKKQNKNTVVCGFMKPEEIEETSQKLMEKPVVIFLDADAKSISERIKSRYLSESLVKELFRATGKSVEKFIEDNIYYSNILRKSCLQNNYKIIETTKKNGAQVAKEVWDFICKEEI
jgi:broad-specificity NMP kinase